MGLPVGASDEGVSTYVNALHIAWTIATKDIVDALRNKNTKVNLILMIGMVLFFYWYGYLRPFDHNVYVVVYDESRSDLTLDTAELRNGTTYHFIKATSRKDMTERWPTRIWDWSSQPASARTVLRRRADPERLHLLVPPGQAAHWKRVQHGA